MSLFSKKTLPSTDPAGAAYPVAKTDEDWRAELSPSEFHVLREAGTERPFVGEYTDTKPRASTHAAPAGPSCSAATPSSTRTAGGRPSTRRSPRTAWSTSRTGASARVRTEVRCKNCGSHLGHVFEGEGYGTPTDQRYCINSISLRLEPKAVPADAAERLDREQLRSDR